MAIFRRFLILMVAAWLGSVQESEAGAVYGFAGASAVLATGRSLHYFVQLEHCKLVFGTAILPEFTEPFGSRVSSWRSFNDKEIAEIPFFVFFEQSMMFNHTDGLVQVSRAVEVWQNDSAIVRTIVYSPDFSVVKNFYEHQCNLSDQNTAGNIEFSASELEPYRLNAFSDVIHTLEAGHSVHFVAMTFICQGGREHSFSNFGGRIINYEITGRVDEPAFQSYVQQTAHYDKQSDTHVVDVINIRLFGNRTAEIVDTRGRAPFREPLRRHVSYCFLDNGAPGASFHIYAQGPGKNVY